MDANSLTGIIVDVAVKIHSVIVPGCFERVYEEILYFELNERGLGVERQIAMPISYEMLYIPDAYSLICWLKKKVIIEIKCVEHVLPVHFKQTMTYLNLWT